MSENNRKALIAQVQAESLITASKQSEISIMEGHGWCKSKFSNQKTPSRKRGGPSILQVFNSHGTSHLDGAVNIGQTGNNSFINCKLLIDTGALVPMSIAISEEFFVVRWGGNTENYKL